jgi:hypothetical protein
VQHRSDPTPHLQSLLPADVVKKVTVTMPLATGKTELVVELTRRSAKDILARMVRDYDRPYEEVVQETRVTPRRPMLDGWRLWEGALAEEWRRRQARGTRLERRRRAAIERKGRP